MQKPRLITPRVSVYLLIIIMLLAACGDASSEPAATQTPRPQPTPDAAALPSITVAWAVEGDLYTWSSQEPQARRIASGAVIRPLLAPDGEQVAYLRGPGGDARTLWISDRLGAAERQLVDAARLPDTPDPRRIWQAVWASAGDRVLFNTLIDAEPAPRPADDLWAVDVASGALERLLPDGQGGRIYPAPQSDAGNSLVLLAHPGVYAAPGDVPSASGGKPATLTLFDLDARWRAELLSYPAVATASEFPWYPDVRWLPNATGAFVAIPPPDLVLGSLGEDAAGKTALWWLPAQAPGGAGPGEAVKRGEVAADFFALPQFSADGQWIAFLAAREGPDDQRARLILARSDGAHERTVLEGGLSELGGMAWPPAGVRLMFFRAGVPLLADPLLSLIPPSLPFLPESGPVSGVWWADGDPVGETLVYAAGFGEQAITLSAASLDGVDLQAGELARTQIIAAMARQPAVDVVRVVPQLSSRQ